MANKQNTLKWGRTVERTARDVMKVDVVSVQPDTSVRHAAAIMLARCVSGLPVIDDEGRLAGIITEGDLMRRSELRDALLLSNTGASTDEWNTAYVKSHSWRVGDVMTAPVVSVDEEAPLSHIAKLLDRHNIRRVPVVRTGRVVGIVSRSDLLSAVAGMAPDSAAAGDQAIRLGIVTRLREDLCLADLIPHVGVAGGIVHLSGDVRSQAERDAVRVVAESVRGVVGIQDHLNIAGRR